MSRAARMRRRRRKHSAGPAFLILGVLTTCIVLGVLGVVGYVVSLAASAPDLSELKPIDQGESSVIYTADGKTKLGFIQASILRTPIADRDIPQTVKDATV